MRTQKEHNTRASNASNNTLIMNMGTIPDSSTVDRSQHGRCGYVNILDLGADDDGHHDHDGYHVDRCPERRPENLIRF